MYMYLTLLLISVDQTDFRHNKFDLLLYDYSQDIVYMYKYMTKVSRSYRPIVKVTWLHQNVHLPVGVHCIINSSVGNSSMQYSGQKWLRCWS